MCFYMYIYICVVLLQLYIYVCTSVIHAPVYEICTQLCMPFRMIYTIDVQVGCLSSVWL